jgi:hypothetical protein
MLEELDSTPLGTRKLGNRIVQFHQRHPMDVAEVLRPGVEDKGPVDQTPTMPEPEGPADMSDIAQHLAFQRQLRSAKARYRQDADPTSKRAKVQVRIEPRQGFNRTEYKTFDEDIAEA